MTKRCGTGPSIGAGVDLAVGALVSIAIVVFVVTYLAKGELPARSQDVPLPESRSAVVERNGIAAAPATSHTEPVTEIVGPEWESDDGAATRATPEASYTIQARLDTTSHRVTAREVIAFSNTSNSPISELFLHLYLNAFASENTVFMRTPRYGGRGASGLADSGWIKISRMTVREMGVEDVWPAAKPASSIDGDLTDMRVPLPRSIASGQTVNIEIDWESKLPAIVERTGYSGSFHMVAQWFPKLAKLERNGTFAHFAFDHFSEFYAGWGDYDVTIDVPASFKIGATGMRVEEHVEGNRRIERHVQRNIHDFVFAAWDQFKVLERKAGPVTVQWLGPPGYSAVAEESVSVAEFALKHFAGRYGSYPYPSLTIVHPPTQADEAGGMEYPTLITTGGKWWLPQRVGWTRALVLHEFAHQYFYGLIATNEHSWPFLDEGLATYAECDSLTAGWADRGVADLGAASVSAQALVRFFGLLGGNNAPIAQASDQFPTALDYRLVYTRTALALQTIDRVYGPGAMQTALARYARRYRFAHPGPEHLLGVVRDVAGQAAANNLSAALFDRGWVDYSVVDFGCKMPQSGTYQCNVVVARRGSLQFPIDVQLRDTSGVVSRVTWDASTPETTIAVQLASPLAEVIVDPDHRVALDDDFANNAAHSLPGTMAFEVLGVDSAILQSAMALVGP